VKVSLWRETLPAWLKATSAELRARSRRGRAPDGVETLEAETP